MTLSYTTGPPPDLRETRRHRCSGCGHRWDGELCGAELCGDCWRKVQPTAHGAPDLRETLDLLVIDMRQREQELRDLTCASIPQATDARANYANGYADATEWYAEKLVQVLAQCSSCTCEHLRGIGIRRNPRCPIHGDGVLAQCPPPTPPPWPNKVP